MLRAIGLPSSRTLKYTGARMWQVLSSRNVFVATRAICLGPLEDEVVVGGGHNLGVDARLSQAQLLPLLIQKTDVLILPRTRVVSWVQRSM